MKRLSNKEKEIRNKMAELYNEFVIERKLDNHFTAKIHFMETFITIWNKRKK